MPKPKYELRCASCNRLIVVTRAKIEVELKCPRCKEFNGGKWIKKAGK